MSGNNSSDCMSKGSHHPFIRLAMRFTSPPTHSPSRFTDRQHFYTLFDDVFTDLALVS